MTTPAPRPGAFLGTIVDDSRVSAWVIDLDEGSRTMLRAVPTGEPRGVALLVPGFTGSREDGRLLLPELAERGWDTWIYSQRGQADSSRTPGHYGSDDFAADAVAVARALAAFTAGEASASERQVPRPVHLVGHSFGGVVAGDAVIREPSAFADVAMLCSGPHGWEGRMDDLPAALDADQGVDTWTLHQEDGLPAALDAEQAFLRERALLTDIEGVRAIAGILETHVDRTAELEATGLPMMVLHGDGDDAWPIEWQRTWALRLGARYEVIADAGHLPNLDQPARTADLLSDFWGAGER